MKKAFVVDLSKESQRILAIYYTDHSTSNQANEVAKKIYELIKNAKHSKEDIILNRNEIKKAFFSPFMPQLENAQVFLSHSHRDKNQVLKVKNYLESNTNCKVFIDSLFWDYKDNVLRELGDYDNTIKIDTESKKTSENFNLSNFISISDALTLILRESLQDMIMKCPYFVFLESKNSLIKRLTADKKDLLGMTYSAWIYEELQIAHSLSKDNLTFSMENFKIEHDVLPLWKKFDSITLSDLSDQINLQGQI
ncbi:hypothetical protein [Helicobacter cetorum]|uniref:TIR domain-containing protein n=1 Tax=Helicobacter cetorum (strain ATCC BAA-429 / MIT 00-7128) TaxID=182217 RepID=I0EKK1_HELC0|nr:hypothetical protein [Helicobacter cetorum]AFI03470.1 hypothetical protein HCW_00885 [Helicobacter cetorum MIT 00-7128]